MGKVIMWLQLLLEAQVIETASVLRHARLASSAWNYAIGDFVADFKVRMNSDLTVLTF